MLIPSPSLFNIRVANAWSVLRDHQDVILTKIFHQEDIADKAKCLHKGYVTLLAMTYIAVIYNNLTTPYATPTTSEDVKTEYDYDAIKKCFNCAGIDLDAIWDQFNIDGIVVTNSDRLVL